MACSRPTSSQGGLGTSLRYGKSGLYLRPDRKRVSSAGTMRGVLWRNAYEALTVVGSGNAPTAVPTRNSVADHDEGDAIPYASSPILEIV